MKYIIALYHTGNNGKTQTLWHLAKLLVADNSNITLYSTLTENPRIDFTLVIKVKGKIILIESKGDPNTNLYDKLQNQYLKYQISFVFCATRTSGKTIEDVDRFANENEFETIWTSTYQIGDKNKHDTFNILKANHLYDVLSQLKK